MLVIHFVLPREGFVSDISAVLQGQTPSAGSSTLGTGNLAARPVAVILGGGYSENFDQVHDAVEEATGGSGVAWLRHDGDKPAPPLGPEYGKAMVARVKEALGKLGAGETGVHWY